MVTGLLESRFKNNETCGAALRRGKRVIVEDIEQSSIFIGTPALEIQLKAGVRACQSTPLVSRSGKATWYVFNVLQDAI